MAKHKQKRGTSRPLTEDEREALFHTKYEVDENGCWVWTAYKLPSGYGRFNRNRQSQYAHRWAYERFVGPIPDGLVIDHLCRNRSCVNPAHLEPVSNRENLVRGVGFVAKHVAKTHCPQGHPYDEENTRVYRGRRHCLMCIRERNRRTNVRRTAERRAAKAAREQA
jgi:hypothetical protein